MIIRKHIRLEDVRLKIDGAGAGTFAGYASVFGGVDSYGDTIIKGAFERTLRNNGKPRMFFSHDWGGLPIGKYTVATEDDHGLYVEGELTPGVMQAADVHAAMKHGTIDGLSIGGFVKAGDYDETETGRIIRHWTKLVEVSPVVFPADDAARIDANTVKGQDILESISEVSSEREFERLLRDAAGFSKATAAALVVRAKDLFGQRGDPAASGQAAAIIERLNRIAA